MLCIHTHTNIIISNAKTDTVKKTNALNKYKKKKYVNSDKKLLSQHRKPRRYLNEMVVQYTIQYKHVYSTRKK